MKTFIAFFSILLIVSLNTSYATIWRINNNDETANYAQIQEAHDDNQNVKSGDTLLIEGSSLSYDEATLTKQLFIIGPGYFLAENPKTSARGASAIINGDITFNPGSDGSLLSGLTFTSNGRLSLLANNITIMRCFLTNDIRFEDNVNNITLIQNYLVGLNPAAGKSITSLILKNNIFTDKIEISSTAGNPRTFSSVENNIFLKAVKITTSTFRNNISLSTKETDIKIISGTIENNLSAGGFFGLDNGNQGYNINNDVLFVNPDKASTDGQWQIDPLSPYINAGKNGTVPGIFGGDMPYVLSGVADTPRIYELSTTGMGTAADGLPVTIKVKID